MPSFTQSAPTAASAGFRGIITGAAASIGVFAILVPSPGVAAQIFRMVTSPTVSEVAPVCGGDVEHDAFMRLPAPKRRAKLGCFLREMSRQLNRGLPSRTDFTTLIERTNVAGVTMTYHFRADVDLSEVNRAEMRAWKPTVREKICSDPGMRQILSLGGIYRYVWRDHDGRYIDTLIVKDCPA
jgi:hypothetical protein